MKKTNKINLTKGATKVKIHSVYLEGIFAKK